MADITKITVGSTTYNIKDANAEKSSNKVNSISSDSTNTQYPSALAVKIYVDEKGFDPSSMPAVSDPVVLNQTQSDWNQSDSNAVDYIKNKPTIPAAQVQSDWNQSNTGSVDYIKNKPTVPTVASSIASGQTGYATGEQVYNYAYTKPSGGIPSTDLASGVQTSLGKADSSLQPGDIYDGLDSTATGKTLSANQGKVLDGKISAINGKIPAQASSSNQLADKDFVNSSIGTNTANYISDNGNPFTNVSSLPTTGITNNDYAFVTGTDSDGNTYYDRYKATVSGSTVTWAKEYRLNNSSFTAAQWSAISSGITASLVTSYSSHISDSTIHVTSSDKTTWNGKYALPSGGIPSTDLASAVQTSLSKADTALQSHQDISGKENTTNKVTSLSSSSTDTQYPSAKCVYNLVGNVETLLAAL